MAVVGVFQNNDVLALSVCTGKPQGQFVRFAAGVHEETDAQRFGKQPRQPLGVAVHIVMEIARIGIEQRELCLRRLDHARMAVADERHVVVNVEIGAARLVVQILHPATHDF